MNIILTIKIPDNFDAEDALWNDLQDETMLYDMIGHPVESELLYLLNLKYGKGIHVEVEAKILM